MKSNKIIVLVAILTLLAGLPVIGQEKTGDEAKEGAKKGFNIDISGLAMARFIGVDEDPSPFNRYTAEPGEGEEFLLEVPQLSISADISFSEKARFFTQLNYYPRLNDENINTHFDSEDNKVAIRETFFEFQDLFGPVDTRIGRLSLGSFISKENTDVLDTTEHTVTPSALNSVVNNILVQGVQFSYGIRDKSESEIFSGIIGINSGMKEFSMPLYDPQAHQYWPHTDVMTDPQKENYQMDSSFGSYVYGEGHDATGKYKLSGYYYTNGVDTRENYETRLKGGAFTVDWKKFDLIIQYLNGQTRYFEPLEGSSRTFNNIPRFEYESVFALGVYEITGNQSLALRYEKATTGYDRGTFIDERFILRYFPHVTTSENIYTLCYNWDINDFIKADIEYRQLDNKDWWGGEEVDDNIAQLNVKLFF